MDLRLGDLADFVEDMMLALVILVVIISYLFAFCRSVSPANWDPPKKN
jgi:hypothetical protein